MPHAPRLLLSCALATTAACGGTPAAGPPPEVAPVQGAVPTPPTSADDVRRLMLDAATSDACGRLRGKFISLPAPSTLSGAESGLAPAAGRWWIRSCTSGSDGKTLKLKIAGPAWSWIDQAANGFHVAQYVYFTASAELQGSLDVGYDPDAKIASIWVTPSAGANARVEPLNDVNARADGFWSNVLVAGSFGLVGKIADAAARKEVGVQGAAQFRDRLGQGATITFDLGRTQLDLMLGKLPKGIVPKRPFGDALPWILNEREALHAGGLQVSGPFDPSGGFLLDATVDRGPGVSYRVMCQTDAETAFDTVARGATPTLPAPSGTLAGKITSTTTEPIAFAPPSCPWVLVTASAGDDPSDVALRVRSDAGAAPAAKTIESAVVKLTIVAFSIDPKKPDGDAWDAFGGAPDPRLTLRTARVSHVLVPTMKDTFQATPVVAAPEPIELTRAGSVSLVVEDVDVGFDDPIGTAIVSLDDVLARGPELELDLKLNGARTGTVRVRAEVIAKR